MAYSEKVLDHYENPRNVGSLPKDDVNVGTGMVGAPACGDVMKLQIKVEDGIITDAKFKTYGCLVSNSRICTPTKLTKIKDLKIDDEVLAWNGNNIVNNKIKNIIKHEVDISNLISVMFETDSNKNRNIKNKSGLKQFKIICTKEHIFWNANNQPIEAQSLNVGDELYEITEHELRILTNVRYRKEFRNQSSKRMKEWNKQFDHSILPQNSKGFKFSKTRDDKLSIASKQKWQEPEYRKNWLMGMSKIDWSKPTSIEQKFIKLFEDNNVAVKYCANKIWLQSSTGPISPDFIVPGKKKCIEVYTKEMPSFMQDRSENSDYVEKRTKQLASAGYDSLFLCIEDIQNALPIVQNFIHNGMKIISIKPIIHGNELRNCDRRKNKIIVYDLQLEDGANVYFTNRVGSHNCGSAIASSSLVTEWVKGKTLAQAAEIKNTHIAQELALPPVKIHCSILAQDAISAAIKDYQDKH